MRCSCHIRLSVCPPQGGLSHSTLPRSTDHGRCLIGPATVVPAAIRLLGARRGPLVFRRNKTPSSIDELAQAEARAKATSRRRGLRARHVCRTTSTFIRRRRVMTRMMFASSSSAQSWVPLRKHRCAWPVGRIDHRHRDKRASDVDRRRRSGEQRGGAADVTRAYMSFTRPSNKLSGSIGISSSKHVLASRRHPLTSDKTSRHQFSIQPTPPCKWPDLAPTELKIRPATRTSIVSAQRRKMANVQHQHHSRLFLELVYHRQPISQCHQSKSVPSQTRYL